MDVKIGETTLAFYRATNTSDHAVTGTSTFNVFPEQAAVFFNKLECFCFKEQTLEPGQSVDLPVSFFVDPQIVHDKDAGGTTHITLSYTFYPVPSKSKAGLAEKPATSLLRPRGQCRTTGGPGKQQFARAAGEGSGSARWPIHTPSTTTTTSSIRVRGPWSARSPPSARRWA
jgi:hypothetical protein